MIETPLIAPGSARYIEVDVAVHHWEGSALNGIPDAAGAMLGRAGDTWRVVIELGAGAVLDWRGGTEASIDYKVRDEGLYWLLDENRTRIVTWKGVYPPKDILCVPPSPLSDYVSCRISPDGKVVAWRRPSLADARWAPQPA